MARFKGIECDYCSKTAILFGDALAKSYSSLEQELRDIGWYISSDGNNAMCNECLKGKTNES